MYLFYDKGLQTLSLYSHIVTPINTKDIKICFIFSILSIIWRRPTKNMITDK